MIRLTLLLCGGLFLALLIGGQDRGQQRFGLMPQSEPTVVVVEAPLASVAEIAATKAAFAPSQPVMDIPVVEETVVVEPGAVIPAEGRLLQVTAKSANVRSGPGKDFDVVGRLVRGESVLVVAEGDGPDGWALIRIEGDGVEGYIAARLLSE
ncbi:MAG: SH3 type 3 domain-containing protein [Rhodobacteraceae bacterium]|uniref:SH3 domain-containing protein n=1 Tax=Cypionkella sp. TaxID=2811411 RepID=UPI00132B54A0|nr:SH3 domain-containing protein [Cypionkella sp.]KAF0174991.1 MAG: SH3 type 3 domain-containing protein [Paracoccaceae bacterium]MDO8325517.1 SH3 domain-containing protein [Cypionkella sp.]